MVFLSRQLLWEYMQEMAGSAQSVCTMCKLTGYESYDVNLSDVHPLSTSSVAGYVNHFKDEWLVQVRRRAMMYYIMWLCQHGFDLFRFGSPLANTFRV